MLTPIVPTILSAIDRLTRDGWCRIIGHDGSWHHGVALGYKTRACTRCHQPC